MAYADNWTTKLDANLAANVRILNDRCSLAPVVGANMGVAHPWHELGLCNVTLIVQNLRLS
jgi:hypothetical protein